MGCKKPTEVKRCPSCDKFFRVPEIIKSKDFECCPLCGTIIVRTDSGEYVEME